MNRLTAINNAIRAMIYNLPCRPGRHDWQFLRNLTDDRALIAGGKSVWKCSRCPATEVRQESHEEPK